MKKELAAVQQVSWKIADAYQGQKVHPDRYFVAGANLPVVWREPVRSLQVAQKRVTDLVTGFIPVSDKNGMVALIDSRGTICSGVAYAEQYFRSSVQLLGLMGRVGQTNVVSPDMFSGLRRSGVAPQLRNSFVISGKGECFRVTQFDVQGAGIQVPATMAQKIRVNTNAGRVEDTVVTAPGHAQAPVEDVFVFPDPFAVSKVDKNGRVTNLFGDLGGLVRKLSGGSLDEAIKYWRENVDRILFGKDQKIFNSATGTWIKYLTRNSYLAFTYGNHL